MADNPIKEVLNWKTGVDNLEFDQDKFDSRSKLEPLKGSRIKSIGDDPTSDRGYKPDVQLSLKGDASKQITNYFEQTTKQIVRGSITELEDIGKDFKEFTKDLLKKFINAPGDMLRKEVEALQMKLKAAVAQIYKFPTNPLYWARFFLLADPVRVKRHGNYRNFGKYVDFWPNQVLSPDSDLPFKGRKTLEGFSMRDDFYWDISLKKYDKAHSSVPENPFGVWIPATGYNLTYESTTMETIPLFKGFGINIPNGLNKVPKVTVSLIEPTNMALDEYLNTYRKAIFTEENKVRPYKDALSLLTIYITSPQMSVIKRKIFAVIPEIEINYAGVSNNQYLQRDITFHVLGEEEYQEVTT